MCEMMLILQFASIIFRVIVTKKEKVKEKLSILDQRIWYSQRLFELQMNMRTLYAMDQNVNSSECIKPCNCHSIFTVKPHKSKTCLNRFQFGIVVLCSNNVYMKVVKQLHSSVLCMHVIM